MKTRLRSGGLLGDLLGQVGHCLLTTEGVPALLATGRRGVGRLIGRPLGIVGPLVERDIRPAVGAGHQPDFDVGGVLAHLTGEILAAARARLFGHLHHLDTGATHAQAVPKRPPTMTTMDALRSPDQVQDALRAQDYLADRGLATAVFLALSLGRPLLLEGEAGVGKTEVAKALAAMLDVELIRLQCYEGIDASQALYEWDYARQLLAIRAAPGESAVADLFSPDFLVERPLLKALRAGDRAVLLIDEVDRADDEFEAFLLEVLSDFQVTVPELGTIQAERPPLVIVTSNRTRDLHDALKRRCLYHWIDYPDLRHEVAIVTVRVPDVPAALATKVAGAVSRLRSMDLVKRPGVAETIDWVRALAALGAGELDADAARDTLGVVVKDHDDLTVVAERVSELVDG